MSKPWLFFGLSGPVAQPLYQRLCAEQIEAIAVSRNKQPQQSKIEWLQGSLQQPPVLPLDVQGIVSLGPLDAFAEWFRASSIQTEKIIALGSASEIFKAASKNRYDQAIAQRLRASREMLMNCAEQRNVNLCVLRPTLIYGTAGGDSLSRAVAMAQRYGVAIIPKPAQGMRQPVHCADLCDVVFQLISVQKMLNAIIDLPGPDTIEFDRMLKLNFDQGCPDVMQLALPASLIKPLSFLLPSTWRSAFDRLGQDQILSGPEQSLPISWAPRHYYG